MLPREQYSNPSTSPRVEWVYVSGDLFTQRYLNARSILEGLYCRKTCVRPAPRPGKCDGAWRQSTSTTLNIERPPCNTNHTHTSKTTFTIPPSIPSTTHTAQKASPGLSNVNPVASPTPTSQSTGRHDTPTSVSRQLVSDQASKNAEIESNMLDGLTPAGEHSAQEFDVTTEPKAPASTFVAPQTPVPPLSLHQSSIAGYDVYQALD